MNHTKPNSHIGVHEQWPSQHAHQQLCASSGYSLGKQGQLFFPSWQLCWAIVWGQFGFILFEMGIFSFVTRKKKWFEVFEMFSEYLFWLKSHCNWYGFTCPIKAWSAWKWNYCSEVQNHPILRWKVRTENSQRKTFEPVQDVFFLWSGWNRLLYLTLLLFLNLSLLLLFLKFQWMLHFLEIYRDVVIIINNNTILDKA